MSKDRVLASISAERDRQDRKWGVQDHDDWYWLAVLTEELGEVARALQEGTNVDEELVQVAAVAVVWLESRARRNAIV